MMRRKNNVASVVLRTVWRTKLLVAGIFIAVVGAVAMALLPPLVLENIINRLTSGVSVPFTLALAYLGFTALIGVMESARESLLTVFGQRVTHAMRSALCAKLSRLPAEAFVKQDSGATAARFVSDVDTLESLFTSGIISMFADACKVVGIFAVIFAKNRGLALLLLVLLPILFWFTREVQKRMLTAQAANRSAIARVTGHVPETIRCIRTIHTLHKERYMRDKYDRYIQDSYDAVDKTNFYDAIYSPVILILNAVIVAAVMLLSATGNTGIQSFFGMSVGTAVAVISYISQVFAPLESIGMEIQTIQSAVAGVNRVNEFLSQPERWPTDESIADAALRNTNDVCIELRNVSFGYDADTDVLQDESFTVKRGEQVTLVGRTGAGKTTVFKLLLGLYRPRTGHVLVNGQDAALLPDSAKRHLFGYVEQSFRMAPGTVRDQITLFDSAITPAQVEQAARTVGLHEAIMRLPDGYDTRCVSGLFSQGQWQLLSIARAIAAEPEILLLDEITANLDADTEQIVLSALKNASTNRTILSISHRLYEQIGGPQIVIGRDDAQPV